MNTVVLVADVGNTDTVFGRWEGRRLRRTWRVRTTRLANPGRAAALLARCIRSPGTSRPRLVVGSVVPAVTRALSVASTRLLGRPARVVTAADSLGIPVKVDRPSAVGVDRVVNCLAALRLLRPPFVVVDLGTATTLDVVDRRGAFVGGVIAPGIASAMQGLVWRAARLRPVPLAAPPRVVGRNTRHAMQSGLLVAHAAMIDGLIARIESQLGTTVGVIATGGLAATVAPLSRRIGRVVPTLTLEGLCRAWEALEGRIDPDRLRSGRKRSESEPRREPPLRFVERGQR